MSTEIIEQITVTGAGLTLSRLIWNRFQAPTDGVLGRIYDLNPGISKIGTELPQGMTVLVPVPLEVNAEPVVKQVTLWD